MFFCQQRHERLWSPGTLQSPGCAQTALREGVQESLGEDTASLQRKGVSRGDTSLVSEVELGEGNDLGVRIATASRTSKEPGFLLEVWAPPEGPERPVRRWWEEPTRTCTRVFRKEGNIPEARSLMTVCPGLGAEEVISYTGSAGTRQNTQPHT